MTQDPVSVAGKDLVIASEVDILVIGAGPAGRAAARQAAEGGASVMLVDEAPVPFETMGEHVPQIWGGRAGGQTRNRQAMMERMLEARPALGDLFEAGVDVRLGTACWGLYVNQVNMRWLPGRLASLSGGDEGTQLVRFGQAVVATGRRDMGLAFPGWDMPGVMGLHAALVLHGLYDALDARRCVVLGATAEALTGALALADGGVEVAAVIERAETAPAPDALLAQLADRGIEIRTGAVPRGVDCDMSGVTALNLGDGAIACDAVLLGVGAVPVIDLLQAAGAAVSFDVARSGFVPRLGAGLATTLDGVRAAGDCCGIWPAKSADPALSEAEGRLAAEAALAALGKGPGPSAAPPAPLPIPPGDGPDLSDYRKGWIRAAVVEAMDEMPVCLCEEVTARDILELRPPRYLNAPAPGNAPRSLTRLLGDGPPDPDQVKRLTRAGMGPCQGRRCREQVQALLALQETLALGAIPLASYRMPVRPLSLAEALLPETPEVLDNWEAWFGMPGQWAPWEILPESYTVATRRTEEDHANE